MKLERLVRQLEIDEGVRLRVYVCTAGHKTVGIGHMISDTDPDEIKQLNVGDKITSEQCRELFYKDLSIAITDAKIIFGDQWESFPDEAQEVFVNMLFNLGRTRFLGFKKMIAAAYRNDWQDVAINMKDSKWAKQVASRATRLITKIERL
jgi:lysozyme